MKKLIGIFLSLILISKVYAGDVTASHTFVNGEVLTAALMNAQRDEIITEVNDLDGDNLASTIAITTSGTMTLTGTFDAQGTTNKIGNGGSDTLTLNVPGGMTLSAATTWTLTGALTFSGTIADLGTVTTANIDGGTIDGSVIGGVTAAAGTFTNLTSTGNTVLGNGADTLTINSSSGITYTPAATWTFSAGQTVSGTWTNLGIVTTTDINGGTVDGTTIGGTSAAAGTFTSLNATSGGALTGTWSDLGTVTTVDINGGTMDGVQIGGTTATGELIVNDATDDADGLGSQGTSGQYLQSVGAGANPVFDTAAPNKSEFLVRLDSGAEWGETNGFDTNGDFASDTFTAPVAGRYIFMWNVRYTRGNSGTGTIITVSIKVGGVTRHEVTITPGNLATGTVVTTMSSVIMNLSASDAVTL